MMLGDFQGLQTFQELRGECLQMVAIAPCAYLQTNTTHPNAGSETTDLTVIYEANCDGDGDGDGDGGDIYQIAMTYYKL